MANNNWKHVGSTHLFEREPDKEPDHSWIGGLIVLFVIVLFISQCSG